MFRHFVVEAGLVGVRNSTTALISTHSKQRAHEMAADDYRRSNNLESSVPIKTKMLFDCDTEEEAHIELTRIFSGMGANETK